MIGISKRVGPALIGAVAVALGAATLRTVVDQLSLPVVRYDATTGECVSVTGEGYDGRCDQIPVRYIHEWVDAPPRDVYGDPEQQAWIAPADDLPVIEEDGDTSLATTAPAATPVFEYQPGGAPAATPSHQTTTPAEPAKTSFWLVTGISVGLLIRMMLP